MVAKARRSKVAARAVAALLCSGALAAGCAKAPVKEPAAGTAVPPATAAPEPSASSEPEASASAAAEAPPQPAPYKPGTVRCGASTCKAGAEACCAFGNDVGCAPATPGNSEPDLLKQSQQCMDRVKSDVSLSRLARCDDSGDCAAGEMSCRAAALGDADVSVCAPPQAGGKACAIAERCVSEVPCRTPGTSCVEGQCRLPGKPDCLGQSCTGSAPLCCGKFDWQGKPSCQAAASCPQGGSLYECFTPGDCPNGTTCQSHATGTACMGEIDLTGRAVVCAKDADCPKNACAASPKNRAKCLPAELASWSSMKTCQCPAGTAAAK
ncbi:MAG: hypothetical protein HY744_29300 [Deltaproteobacteria bacterium]|nr:hypothetical protein [Deltaproteobacteria bacterium]